MCGSDYLLQETKWSIKTVISNLLTPQIEKKQTLRYVSYFRQPSFKIPAFLLNFQWREHIAFQPRG